MGNPVAHPSSVPAIAVKLTDSLSERIASNHEDFITQIQGRS